MNVLVKVLLSAAMVLTQYSDEEWTVFQKSWNQYREYFVKNGRIVDTANQAISHSEGQGYGMLFAVAANDKEQFKQIWDWTKKTLQRTDHLFSWKFVPCPSNDSRCITDKNNATDGDILIAWALITASEQWDNTEYRSQAIIILDVIKQKLVRSRFGYHLLIPGEYGFEVGDNATQINLSYWVFPALKKFFDVTGDPIWNEVYQSGGELLQKVRFGRWELPPDWVILSEQGPNLDNALSQEYGYNACRVPIYLMLANHVDLSLVSPFLAFWNQLEVPAVVNLKDGSVAEYTYSTGMEAIAIATKRVVNDQKMPKLPKITPEMDYYSASLVLLSQLALMQDNYHSDEIREAIVID